MPGNTIIDADPINRSEPHIASWIFKHRVDTIIRQPVFLSEVVPFHPIVTADTGTISDTDTGSLPLPEIQSPREDDIFRTDEAVVVSGTVGANAVAVQVSVNGTELAEEAVSGNTFSVTLPAPQPEGVLVISVTARDGLGMTSGAATINPIAWD